MSDKTTDSDLLLDQAIYSARDQIEKNKNAFTEDEIGDPSIEAGVVLGTLEAEALLEAIANGTPKGQGEARPFDAQDASPQLAQLLYRMREVTWEKDGFYYKNNRRENLIIGGQKTGFYVYVAGYKKKWWNIGVGLEAHYMQNIKTEELAKKYCIKEYANNNGFYESV